jgi:fatty acid desaturase
MAAETSKSGRVLPYHSRVPSKFEKVFSAGIVSIVTILGILILLGVFSIDPGFRLPLGLILVGYGVIRFWMLKSRYRKVEGEKENMEVLTKEDEKKLRN